jgi:LAO/AO transport system kinase
MVDFFLVMLLAGGGDDLQGIKKGIIEIADMLAVNKADGDNVARAGRAAGEYQSALAIFTPKDATWQPPVLTISGRDNTGLDTLWAKIEEHREKTTATGEFAARRQQQAVTWMREMLRDKLMSAVHSHPLVAERLPLIETGVREGLLMPAAAVEEIVALLDTDA